MGIVGGPEYSPAIWSTPDEVVEAVKALVPYNGFYTENDRSSGDAPMWWKQSQDAAKPSVLDSTLTTAATPSFGGTRSSKRTISTVSPDCDTATSSVSGRRIFRW